MIREAVVEGQVYAVLHGNDTDPERVQFWVVDEVPNKGGYVWGHRADGVSLDWLPIHTRSIRSTMEDWNAGVDRTTVTTQRNGKNLAGWLRRIASDPDASDDLQAAARKQLRNGGMAA